MVVINNDHLTKALIYLFNKVKEELVLLVQVIIRSLSSLVLSLQTPLLIVSLNILTSTIEVIAVTHYIVLPQPSVLGTTISHRGKEEGT